MENTKGDIKSIRSKGSLMVKVIPIYTRTIMVLWMVIADLLSLIFAGWLAIHIRGWVGNFDMDHAPYLALSPLLLMFLVMNLISGLFPGIGLSPVDEIRLVVISTSSSFVLLTAIAFLTQTGVAYSRLVFVFFWLLAVTFEPTFRMIFRKLGVVFNFWGEPFAIIGFGVQGRRIYKYLKQNPLSGIRPVVIVNGESHPDLPGEDEIDLTMISGLEMEKDRMILKRNGITSAILAPSEISAKLRDSLVDEHQFGLKKLILISSLNWTGGTSVVAHDMGGLLGLEVERNLLNPPQRILKKLLDILLFTVGMFVGFPVLLLCAILIKLDSPGPIFFKHERVGRKGKKIMVWKFRTMYCDAEAKLEDCFCEDPDLRLEWEQNHKLKNDPRVTRVGRIIRKTSLDELPQLINILKGEMSFIGPRPIVEEEVKYYEKSIRLYYQVLPGLTGLWQVSGRSETTYENRVLLDNYYIRHWSIWMDIYILVRTLWVVIKRSGAY